jgi:hypothetical protein
MHRLYSYYVCGYIIYVEYEWSIDINNIINNNIIYNIIKYNSK